MAGRRASLRQLLLVGILVPVILLIGVNTHGLYEQALRAADTAYDRTLLASAKSIGELLEVVAPAGTAQLRASLPYAALEPFEADNRSRMVYKVTGFAGEVVSGYADLPAWRGRLPAQSIYAALVDFYDDVYNGEAVRVAVLLQPVAGAQGLGMATIQVAETLELRQTLARQLLADTLWRQVALVGVIALVVVLVVQRATRPIRDLSAELATRSTNDLTPLEARSAPRELTPLVDATNHVMTRLAHLLEHQKRFVRDTSHQLRTPLAVLKVQVQSALRGDVDARQALDEIGHTVERATQLANQMLALAKVEQLRQQHDAPVCDWAPTLHAVALDLAPLIAGRRLDFHLDAAAAPVRAHEWALRELTRNLLHNAIKHCAEAGPLGVTLTARSGTAQLTIADSGPGLAPDLRERLFQPFAAASVGGAVAGSGLGLSICHEIVASLGGTIELHDRLGAPGVLGLDAVVHLPLVANREAPASGENRH